MDVVLVSIAGLSLFLAIAMGVILFKVLREDRQRSDARVAALVVASATLEPSAALRDREVESAPALTLGPGELFAVPRESSPWGRRIGVAATVAAVIATAGYVMMPAAATDSAVSASAAQNVPLELLTLTHTHQPSGLTITGSVYNPRGAAPVSQVFASAILFGPDGNFLTSGRAALDFTTLAPGQESPFVISVPVTGTVARYRVGFRAADGSVIAHVDRRADGTAARNTPSGSTPWRQ